MNLKVNRKILAIIIILVLLTTVSLLIRRPSRKQVSDDQLRQQILTEIKDKTAPDLVKEGKELLEKNQLDRATIYLEEAAQKDRNYRDAWVLAGYAHILKNDPKGALKYLPRAANLDPVYGFTHYLLAKTYSALNYPDLAQEHQKKAEELEYRP